MAIVDTPLTLAYQWPQITTFTNNVIDASGEWYDFLCPKNWNDRSNWIQDQYGYNWCYGRCAPGNG